MLFLPPTLPQCPKGLTACPNQDQIPKYETGTSFLLIIQFFFDQKIFLHIAYLCILDEEKDVFDDFIKQINIDFKMKHFLSGIP